MIRHNCGVCLTHSLHDVYSFTESLQHRGREAVGIVAIGDQGINGVKWLGNVGRLSRDSLARILGGTNYHTYLGHVRYATKGDKDIKNLLYDAHPHVVGGEIQDNGNHIVIKNAEAAIVHNGHIDNSFFKDLDKRKLKTDCDSEKLLHYFIENGANRVIEEITGSYVAAIADNHRKEVIVLRDKTGLRPGILGIKDGRHGMASEDIAFLQNGGKILQDLIPGSVYYFDNIGGYRKKKVSKPEIKHCMFEYQYLAHENSILNRINTRVHREILGEILAEEVSWKDFDFVTYLPESPRLAARSFSEITGLPFIEMFYKMRKERSFQGSTKLSRENSIGDNLFLSTSVKDKVRGKRGILIDDSGVRGNNAKRARQLAYEDAEVEEMLYTLYTPQIGIIGEDGISRGCTNGVDMPPEHPIDHFMARDHENKKNRTLKEIGDLIKMPVHYISQEGLFRAFNRQLGITKEYLCYFCIGGPTPFVLPK